MRQVLTSTPGAAPSGLAGTQAPAAAGARPALPSAPAEGEGAAQSARNRERIGERKIFFEGQAGADVVQLQQRLAGFGFLQGAFVSGKFDKETKDALTAFQHKFGIYVDGVAGSVTAKVLRFLESIDYQPDNVPVSDDTLVLIQRVTRSQKLGIALIGNSFAARTPSARQADDRLKITGRVSRELENLLNEHPVLQGAEFPEGYPPERTVQLANSIDAELVVYLEVLDSPDVGPGTATFFFSTGMSDSAIGAPLAECIHDELLRVQGARDRGCKGEDSPLLQGPNAPAVRVELGNLSDPDDRTRLEDGRHAKELAKAVMAGISRLYDLALPGPIIMTSL